MLDIEQSIADKFPAFAAFTNSSPMIKKPALSLLRRLSHEEKINAFLRVYGNLSGMDFIDAIFDYFDFSYAVSQRERCNIPAHGRVVIVANHPIGSLDGLALLRLVGEVRSDVKIVANDILSVFQPLRELLLPVDNLNNGFGKQFYKSVINTLEQEQALIIFPAGEVSRAGPQGIRDGRWQAGFLHFARKTGAPVLPVHIDAGNSLWFYGASMLFKPLGMALLANEMFNKKAARIQFRIGELIPQASLQSEQLADKSLIARLKKHLYKIGRGKDAIFVTEKTIAHPEAVPKLKQEFKTAQLLGKTRDQQRIYLCSYGRHRHILREVGRLREVAFRKVGEGTGKRRDLDDFDHYYQHLVLWDQEQLAIAGSYRLGEVGQILRQKGVAGCYSAGLFAWQPQAKPYLEQALELGRSFVHPDYWGKAGLDYLWQGIGAYLSQHPQIRYLIGPVSISAHVPLALRERMVLYYRRYYAQPEGLACALHPVHVSEDARSAFERDFAGLDRIQGFALLQNNFQDAGHKIPVLYKQYAALFEEGGWRLLDFGVDSAFSNCIDGLFIADLQMMKANKRERYYRN